MKDSLLNKKQYAGGIPAILSSLKHAIQEMGIWKSISTLSQLNQKNGFDCPGCAWPDPDQKRSMAEFCENGVKAVAEEATLQKVSNDFFQFQKISDLATKDEFYLGKQGRISHPMFKRQDSDFYEPISWKNALQKIVDKLYTLDDPNEAIFYTSGRTSNEAAFLYQLFVRMYGTNNLPDCSNMCHESSGTALKESIGIGKGTVSLDDFEHADCILVIGQNPGTNHPRMLSALQKAARNNCKIIQINPLEEIGTKRFVHPQEISQLFGNGTQLAAEHISVKINGDGALLKGIVKSLLELEKAKKYSLDQNFIQKYCEGFSDYKKQIGALDWNKICTLSGQNKNDIEKIATIIAGSKSMISCWAMGITQHIDAVANIQEIVNLHLLGGHLGRKGAGLCPVRGHSNVQGDRTMGIWEKPSKDFLSALEKQFNFHPPKAHGYDTVEAIQAMAKLKAKVFIAMGGNFLSASPDTNYTAKALKNCDLTVQISTKLNRSHFHTGREALILPCLGRTEIDKKQNKTQFVTVENSMGIVHRSRGKLNPISDQCKSEVDIITSIADLYFQKDPKLANIVNWKSLKNDYDKIRELISKTITGFQDYNSKIRQESGFYLENPVRDQRIFPTDTGKAQFFISPLFEHNLKKNEFLLMTIRSHDQYNTTIYGLNDRYRNIKNKRRVLFMNPVDIRKQNLENNQLVSISSHYNSITRTINDFELIPYNIPENCLASYFPETNPIIPIEHTAKKSNTPASKSIIVTIH